MCGKSSRDRQGGDWHVRYHTHHTEESLVPLDTQHVTDRAEMSYTGYAPENGVALRDDGCHRLAEVFHSTGTPHPGFAPADLYARIGSSHEAAVRASERLK
jgi:hypothetical protein